MAINRITLAVFDFDGTLTKGHLWVGIAKHHRKYKVRRLSLYAYLFSHLPFWLASKLKICSEEKNRSLWGQDLPALFKGFSKDEARKAFKWVIDNYFNLLMRQEVMEALNEHKKQGHKIVLLSGVFTDFLEVLGKTLGADYVVGTKLEIMNDAYSGHIIKPLCFGGSKAKLLSEFIQKKRLDVDLKQSSAYADSIFDISVFQMVGNPVATYPDKALLKLAQDKKWRVIN